MDKESVKCCGIIYRRKSKEHMSCEENTIFKIMSVQNKAERINDEIYCDTQHIVFRGDLPNPLLPGHCIGLVGEPQSQCERFAVNFLCKDDPDSDIAFHFNPRLNEKYIVRNSKRHGRWDEEETTSHIRLDLPRNKTFHLSFFIAPKEFMVSLNLSHFCSFEYRIPISKVHFMEVCGDVTINDVEVGEWTRYPILNENVTLVPFEDFQNNKGQLNGKQRENVFSQPNPFIGHLKEGFQLGWQLEIYGKVKMLAQSFFVNLQEGNQLWPQPNIPLHLNPRFNMTLFSNTFIRNAKENGKWGSEERSPGFNFAPSKPFHLVIQLDQDMFAIWVNGMLEGEFRIRSHYGVQQIDTVYIQGDIYIYNIFVRKRFLI